MALKSNNLNLMFIAILAILIHNLIYSFENFKKRIIFFSFQITFFTFLLSKITLSIIEGKGIHLQFQDSIIRHIFTALFLSLVFIFIGFAFVEKSTAPISDKENEEFNLKNKKLIRIISKWIFYISYFPSIAALLEKVFFVMHTGYLEYYTKFQTNLPFMIIKMGQMADISFFIFLATMPSKNQCKKPMFLYLVYGIISLGYGQRNQFVLNILMIGIYYCFRYAINDNNEKWLDKKTILLCTIAIPFLIAFLGTFQYMRIGREMDNFSFLNVSIDFFDKQGGSVALIGYAEQFKEHFPQNIFYSFGPLIDFLRDNIFSNLIFNFPHLKENTIEMAVKGYSFGQTITYLVMPENYLSGIGLGSSYIAETYLDFGYAGVCIINLIYGVIIAKIYKICKSNIWIYALSFMMIKEILFAPRNTALGFITPCLSLINFLTIMFIIILKLLFAKIIDYHAARGTKNNI